MTRASIRFESVMRGPDECTGVQIFEMSTSNDDVLFEVEFKFTDENSFIVLISNFGLRDKYSAGYRSPLLQRSFSLAEIDCAKKRLTEFFSGSEKKDFFPFLSPTAHFVEVQYDENCFLTSAQRRIG